MARTARLAHLNLVTEAASILTASSAQYGYPVTNLKSPERYVIWKSAVSAADHWVQIDLGAAAGSWGALLVVDATIRTGGSLRVQAHASASWGAPTINNLVTTQVSPTGTGVAGSWWALSALRGERYVRIYWPSGANEAVQLGAVFVGSYLQPAYSLAPGYGLRLVELSDVARSAGGQRSASRGRSYWELEGQFEASPDAERPALVALAKSVGRFKPFVLAINPDDPAYFSYYGRFDELPRFGHLTGASHWRVAFRFSEDVGSL